VPTEYAVASNRQPFIELAERSGLDIATVVQYAMRGELYKAIDAIETRKAQATRPHSTAFERRAQLAKRAQVINTAPARRYDGDRHLHVPAGS
jgi:hypothetical protein